MQSFFLLIKVDETRLDPRIGKHIEETVKELHRATNAAPGSSCTIYQAKDPAKMDEWERQLRKVNGWPL